MKETSDWWHLFGKETPTYVNYLCARDDNSLLICADNSIHLVSVEATKKTKKQVRLGLKHEKSF